MVRKLSMARAALASAIPLLFASPAHAHIPGAEAILSSVANRRGALDFSNIVAEGKTTRGDETFPVWEAVKANGPRRQELKRPSGTEIVFSSGAQRWRMPMGGKAGAPERNDVDPILTFIGATESDPGAKRALRFLAKIGAQTEVVSLARQDGRPAFVIGARPWEPDKPQLWIDKALRVPVRVVQRDPAGGWIETRLLGFGSAATNEWFPSRIEVRKNGQLIEQTTYSKAQLNVRLDDKLFAPPS